MLPTENLVAEHDIIQLVLSFMEQLATKAGQPDFKEFETLDQLVDFFRTFTDKLHHAKEEKHLFPKMVEHGMSLENGPIACMLSEHVQGRELVSGIAGALADMKQGRPEAKALLLQNISSYVALLRTHIDKENDILYPMANEMFTEKDQSELSFAFNKVEKELMGGGVPEKYRQWAKKLPK